MKLRHVVKVHAIDASHKGQRDENTGHDRQYLHDLVLSVSYARQIDIHQAAGQLPIGLDHIYDLHTMIVDVAQISADCLADEFRFITNEAVD